MVKMRNSLKTIKKFSASLKGQALYVAELVKNKRRAGHPLSRVFRYLFESKKIKGALGLNLAIVAVFAGMVSAPISAFSNGAPVEVTTISPAVNSLTTVHSVRIPLDSLKVNQGYHFLHWGVDLDGQLGEPVYPVMDGVVEDVLFGRFSYGNHIIINHGSGFKSLYAHLAKTVVQKGQEVDKNTVIGTIGSTGWSTGPHLHIEVYDNGKAFNPLTILQ